MHFRKCLSICAALCLTLQSFLGLFTYAADAESPFSFIYDSDNSLDGIKVYTSVLYKGDVNADRKVNSKDLLIMKKHIAGSSDVNVTRITADVNDDGRINSRDLLYIKRAVSGDADSASAGNTAVTKAFSASESAACLSVAEAGKHGAVFEVGCSGAEFEGCEYFGVMIKGADGIEVSAYDREMNSTAGECVYTVSCGEYTGYMFKFASPLGNTSSFVETVFNSAPANGATAYVDSVVFSENADAAKSFIDLRAETRRAEEPEREDKYFTINFDSPEALSDISASNHTSVTYSDSYNALKLQVSGASGDPWALLDLDKYGISADEYKYIVYTSMVPSECHLSMPEGELFYAAGDIAGPSSGYSNIYSQTKDSKFHSKIFEMTNADFWKGTVHSLRFDYYCSAAVGDTQYVRSVVFCNTYEAAAKIALEREVPTNDIKELFFYGKFTSGSFKLSYRMYVPYDYDPSNEYPVLMLLHGAGERGSDGTYHLTQGFPYLFSSTSNSVFGAIVMAPQCPEGYRWVETDWSGGNYSVNAIPESEPMKGAMSVLGNIFRNYSVDRNRVFASGMSMGGFGTWDVLARHSDIFAAGVPICGGGDPSKVDILKNIPIKTFHGTSDNIVPSRGTKEMYDTICAAGGTKISYTPMGGRDHFIWDDVYKQTWVYDWLLSQNMKDR